MPVCVCQLVYMRMYLWFFFFAINIYDHTADATRRQTVYSVIVWLHSLCAKLSLCAVNQNFAITPNATHAYILPQISGSTGKFAIVSIMQTAPLRLKHRRASEGLLKNTSTTTTHFVSTKYPAVSDASWWVLRVWVHIFVVRTLHFSRCVRFVWSYLR